MQKCGRHRRCDHQKSQIAQDLTFIDGMREDRRHRVPGRGHVCSNGGPRPPACSSSSTPLRQRPRRRQRREPHRGPTCPGAATAAASTPTARLISAAFVRGTCTTHGAMFCVSDDHTGTVTIRVSVSSGHMSGKFRLRHVGRCVQGPSSARWCSSVRRRVRHAGIVSLRVNQPRRTPTHPPERSSLLRRSGKCSSPRARIGQIVGNTSCLSAAPDDRDRPCIFRRRPSQGNHRAQPELRGWLGLGWLPVGNPFGLL